MSDEVKAALEWYDIWESMTDLPEGEPNLGVTFGAVLAARVRELEEQLQLDGDDLAEEVAMFRDQDTQDQLTTANARIAELEAENAKLSSNYQDCYDRLGEWQSETGCTHPAAAHQKIADRDDLLSGVAASIDLSGLDVSPCMDCGTPIVCIPDGMPMCEKCAGKLELTPEQRDAAIDEAGEST